MNNYFKINILPSVTIIIINWNAISDTRKCIQSLLQLNYQNKNIVVVDNNSSNNEANQLKKEFKSFVTVINNSFNSGFAEGNNIGIRYDKNNYNSDYIWLLNNDTEVDKNSLTTLVNKSLKNYFDIVGSYIQYWQSDKIYCLGGGKINLWTGIDKLYGAKKNKIYKFIPKSLGYISGCSLLFKKDVYKKIGGLDPDYFVYNEETDFCFKANKAGFKLGYAEKSIVYHKFAQSTKHYSPTYIYYLLRNKLIFMKKNAKIWHWPSFMLIYILYYLPGFTVKSIPINKCITFKIITKSISDFIFHHWGKQKI